MRRRVHLLVHGRVQGVFYRVSARDEGRRRGLAGWVRNLPDGRVECVAEGEEGELRGFVDWCRSGPPGARVERVEEEWSEATGDMRAFEVRF